MSVVRFPPDANGAMQTEIAALRASEARFRALADAVPVLIASCDAERRFKFVNRPYAERLGRSPEEVIGRRVADVFGREVYGEVRPYIDAVLSGRQVEFDVSVDGGHLRCSYAPERDADGAIVGWFAAIVDITERKSAERELAASEERYRRLAQLLPVGVYTCDAPSGVITYYNEQAVRLWGRAPRLGDPSERYCGSVKLQLPDGRPLPHDQCPMAMALREGRSFRNQEVYVERPDGTVVCVLVNIDPVHDADGAVAGAINVFHDMSALKHAEHAVREQKENLQTLLDTVPVAVFIAEDADCRRITGNRAAAELLRMPASANLAISGAVEEQPKHFRLLDGGLPLAHESLPVRRAARGEIVRGEEIGLAFDDGTVLHMLVSAQPLVDSAGRSRGAVASALDITTLKNAELALREADRRKDEFLATLSHELRNPLAPIGTALGILDAVRSDSDRFADLTAVMERQLARLVRLIDDLLDVSRISRGKLKLRKEPVELQALVREAVETTRLHGSGGHELELVLPAQPIRLEADAVRLGQVFSNLLSNAAKYTPAGGRIRVAVERRNGDAEVRVADTGVGLPPEKIDAIFEMFAQLESPDERSHGGLGIGLSLARQFAELHGGTIEARSDGIGRGSEFVVRLPVRAPEEAPLPADAGGAPASEPASARRILVVDDNVDAATTLAALLEMQGHRVEAVHDGAAAVERAAAIRPAVILLDIGLPCMDGYAVCRAIRGRPWGKEIFIAAVTGWGQETDRRQSAAAGFDAHLVKPVDARVLTRLIEALHVGAARARRDAGGSSTPRR